MTSVRWPRGGSLSSGVREHAIPHAVCNDMDLSRGTTRFRIRLQSREQLHQGWHACLGLLLVMEVTGQAARGRPTEGNT